MTKYRIQETGSSVGYVMCTTVRLLSTDQMQIEIWLHVRPKVYQTDCVLFVLGACLWVTTQSTLENLFTQYILLHNLIPKASESLQWYKFKMTTEHDLAGRNKSLIMSCYYWDPLKSTISAYFLRCTFFYMRPRSVISIFQLMSTQNATKNARMRCSTLLRTHANYLIQRLNP